MKLASHTRTPPGNYRYRHGVSGLEMSRHSWSLLRSDVTAHCAANGYPEISDAEIENQICSRLGPGVVERYCEGTGISVRGVGWNWREIMRGTTALGHFLLSGRKRVAQEEAERRAAICSPCLMNTSFAKPCSGGCPELTAAVQAIVGGEGTSHDGNLFACALCGCDNRAQVFVPVESLAHGVDVADFIAKAPEKCWKLAALLEMQ